jgi:hypothetical protein
MESGCLVKLYEDASHVVAAYLLGGILGQQEVQQLQDYSLHVFAGPAFLNNLIHHSLAVGYIFFPDSIATHNDKLVLLGSIGDCDVGLAND